MFGAGWIGSLQAVAQPRKGELPAAMFTEMSKLSPQLIPLVTIEFPPTTETLVFSPTATAFESANHDVEPVTDVHLALDDPPGSPSDDDGSFVRSDALNALGESRVTYDALPSGIISIEEVRLYCRGRTHNATTSPAGAWSHALVLASTNYYRDGLLSPDRFFNQAYKTVCFRYPTNPATLAKWLTAEVDSLEHAVITQVDGEGASFGDRITQVWMEVDVTRQEIGRYAPIAVNSKSRGLFDSRIVSMSNVTRSVLNINNSLEGTSGGCVLADTDREFSDYVANNSADVIRTAKVTVEYGSPNVPPASWFPVFTGLLDTWKEQSLHRWQLGFKPEDKAIEEGVIPTEKISERVFEAAPDPKVYDNFAPLIYGRHDSEELTDDGMLPTFRVSDRQLACSLARLKQIIRVYARDQNSVTLLTESASDGINNYEVEFPIFNGVQWTFIKLQPLAVTEQFVTNSRDIVFDCLGYEEIGDGTGLLIDNPADVWKHMMVNWVFGKYKSGLWLDETLSRVDLTKLTEAKNALNLLGQSASRYIGGKGTATKVKQEMNRFAKNFQIKQFWTGAGEIALKLNEHTTIDIYPEDMVVTEGIDTIVDPSFNFDSRGLINEIFVSYLHKQDEGKFLANLTVADLEILNAGNDSLQAFWLPSSLPQAAA